jgi:hypothetical protein
VTTPHRKAIDAALKAKLLPALRDAGFIGTYPKLRRTVGDRLDFLDVQHSTSGGRFYVNLGQAPAEGFTRDEWLSTIPLGKLDASHCHPNRTRLNPKSTWWKRKNSWEYGPRMYDDNVPVREPAFYEEIAGTLAERFADVGEAWFARPDMEWRKEYRGAQQLRR